MQETNDRVRYFVGTCPNGSDAESLMVLDYSVRKHTNRDVEIIWMAHSNNPDSFWYGWNGSLWATPFSGFRWGIPAYCGFEGKAIYSDSDVIWLSDIGRLWDQPFDPGKVVMTKGGGESWRYCVCKWNNAPAGAYLLPIERLRLLDTAHRRMMGLFSTRNDIVQPFEGNWNCIDGENLPIEKIDCLHYSDMSTQPHLAIARERLSASAREHWYDGPLHDHWRADIPELFDRYFQEALDSGYKVEDYDFGKDGKFVSYTKESQANYDLYRHKWSK